MATHMQRAALAGAALIALAGCSTAETASSNEAAQVPAGVAEQYATLQQEIAAEGGEKAAGPWTVGYIVEPAEPWHETRDGKQVFRPVAAGETHHLEIIPRETATGRIVPNAGVRLEVLDAQGKVVQAKDLQPYYGEFLHHAENFAVPTAGTYSLRATVQPPAFRRHGEQHETPALTEAATVTFEGVRLEPTS